MTTCGPEEVIAMRRRITIAVLALGTVLGYGSGIAHIAHVHACHSHCAREAAVHGPSSAP
jgi:hypothetical protein